MREELWTRREFVTGWAVVEEPLLRLGSLDVAVVLGEIPPVLLRERLVVLLARFLSSRRLLASSLSGFLESFEDGKGRAGWLEPFGLPSGMLEAKLGGDRDQNSRCTGSHQSRSNARSIMEEFGIL
jgi:hypothetical protein